MPRRSRLCQHPRRLVDPDDATTSGRDEGEVLARSARGVEDDPVRWACCDETFDEAPLGFDGVRVLVVGRSFGIVGGLDRSPSLVSANPVDLRLAHRRI